MSLRNKLLSIFCVTLVIFLSLATYFYFRTSQAQAQLTLVNKLYLPVSRQTVELYSQVQSLAEDMRRFYFKKELTSEQSAFSRMARDLYPYIIQKKFRALETLLEQHQKADLLASLSKIKQNYYLLSKAREQGDFDKYYTNLQANIKQLAKKIDWECQAITLAAQSETQKTLSFIGLFSFLIVILSIGLLAYSQKILQPLPSLIQSLNKIASGDFKQSLKIRTSDTEEISILARAYNRMLEALNDRDLKIREQQRELLQNERLAAVGQLSAEVVHEIRNPLNSISLNIDWLDDELKSSESEVKKTLKSISREVERLNQITESYLVRAKVPSNDIEKTDVNDLIFEILEFTREEDRSQNIQVEQELCQSNILLPISRSRLKQAFLNVIKNAKEAMPNGGKIRVRTEVKENVSRILISDSGSGMNESTFKSSFHPFFTTKSSGTGLGLSLVKTIVEEARGTINCESQLGKGTTFAFQFPI